MSAFVAAVQDLVAADAGTQQEAGTAFQAVLAVLPSASKEETNWTVQQLVERLVRNEFRYCGLLACMVERCLASGADPFKATGPLVELMVRNLILADQFDQTSADRIAPLGVHPEDADAAPIWEQLIREDPQGADAWNQLDLWCMASAGCLSSFEEARALFYRLGGSLALLTRLASQRQGPGELLRVLQEHPQPPFDDPRLVIDSALDRLVNGDDPSAAGGELYRGLFAVESAVVQHTLERLRGYILSANPEQLGGLANIAGTLVEQGGDPSIAGPALLDRLTEVLPQATTFLNACLEAARSQGVEVEKEDPNQIVAAFASSVGPWVEGLGAYESLNGFCLATIAHLARSPDLRKEAREREDLLLAAATLSEAHEMGRWLVQMLQVLDGEKLVVLAPAERLGWKVTMAGIGDNFQLHTLLLGTLLGPAEQGLYPGLVEPTLDGLPPGPGVPFHPRIVAIARDLPCCENEPRITSSVQLWNWPALDREGKLPGDVLSASQWFIWNEGTPADILSFDGVRVVLLGPGSYPRSWNGGRIFPGMSARLELDESLSLDDIDGWLSRLSLANRPIQ